MYKFITRWLTAAMAATVVVGGYDPRPENGYAAGLIPECPGVTKNASISRDHLPLLQVTLHKVSWKGQVERKTVPILLGPRAVAKDKDFDLKNRKTVLYAVGFWDNSWTPHTQAVATAYAKRGYNVLVTQTFAFLTQIYPKSVRLVPYIAKEFSDFLLKLMEQGLTADNLELTGHSLGAHVVGLIAKHFYNSTGLRPSRVTGLDPAGPCIRSLSSEHRLAPTDGENVDVVHTNIDGFGMPDRLGQVDFYVNGGEYQPGDIPYLPCLTICSHLRAALYWWQAIENPKKFIAIKCDSIQDARFAKCYNNTELNYLGLKTDFSKPGIYYLPTHNEFPYYRGKEGLKAENEIYKSVSKDINAEDNFIL